MAIGDEQGSRGRQEELKRIREESVKATESINFLNESIKTTQRQLKEAGGIDFMKAANVGMDSLTKKMSQVTVETLKSSKARKQFSQDLIKAQEQQAQNEAALVNIQKERELLTLDLAKREQEVAQLRKQGAAAYEAEMDKVKGIVLQAKDEEIQAEQLLLQARKSGDQARIAAAEATLGEARLNVKAQENVQAKTQKIAEEKRANFERDAEERQEEIDDLGKINALYGVQADQINERNRELESSINKGKQLEQTMKEIDSAPGAFIKGFEDFSKIVGQIPILGAAFEAIAGDISKSAEMFREAKAEGKGFFKALGTAAAGFIKLGAFAAISAFVTQVIEGAKIGSDAMKTLNKSVAGSTLDMSTQMGRVAAAAGKFTVPLSEAAATIAGINEALGMQLDFTAETTEQAIKLTNKYGLSADATAKLVKLSAANKDTMTETVDAVTAGVAKFNAMNDVSISTKAIFDDIAHASATTLNGIGKQPGAIAAAAAAARSLGMSMEDIRAAAETTTDFQKSLTDEMTTEMMLGKQLNLQKLREAALTGDVKTQAEEMKRLVMENAGRIGNNVKLQEQFASTLGISRDQYNDMLKTQDAMSVLTDKSGAAQQENDKNRKKTNAEIAESVERSVGKLTSLADKLAKMQEGIATGAKGFFDQLLEGFEGETLYEKIKNGLTNAFNISVDALKEGITNLMNGDFSGSSLGKMLGALAVLGGGAAITLKATSGLKKLFLGERGSSPANPMYVSNSGMGDMFDSLTKGLRPRNVRGMNLTKKLSNLFGGKNTIVGKQLRNFAAMFGKRSSMFSQVFKGFTNSFKLGGPKILSGVTNMFSKVGPGISKVAGPLLGKVLAPLELAMGGFKGYNQVANMTDEEKKEAGIRADMGKGEAATLGVLTGGAERGSMFSETLGIEKGSAADDAMGIAGSAGRGAMVGAAIGSIIPGVGTAIGAGAGAIIGGAAEAFKVFSDPNSQLRKKVGEGLDYMGDKLKQGWENAKEFGNTVKEKLGSAFSSMKDKASEFAAGFGERLSSAFSGAKTMVSDLFNGVKDKAKNALNYLKETKLGKVATDVASKVKDSIKSGWNKLTSVFSFADGGVVTKPTIGLIGEAGEDEAIVPLSKAKDMGFGMDVGKLGNMFGQLIRGPIKLAENFTGITDDRMDAMAVIASDQLKEFKKAKEDSDEQHRRELVELRNQTALLFEYIQKPQKSVIKMNTFRVGQTLTKI